MKPTDIYSINLPANGTHVLRVAGEYFKVLQASGIVSVRSTWGRLSDLVAGQGLENTPFEYLELINGTASPNTVKVLIGDRNFIDGMSGVLAVNDTVPARTAAFVSAAKTVTNASAQLVAANASREYLLIQNNHPSASVFINFGAAAALTGCVKIIPGGAFELGSGVVTTQQINAIGDVASNVNVVAVEG